MKAVASFWRTTRPCPRGVSIKRRRALLTLGALIALAHPARADWNYAGVVWDADWESRSCAYGTPEAQRQMSAVGDLGFNAIEIMPISRQNDVHKPAIGFNPDLEPGLARDLRYALSTGLKVVYMPQIFSKQFMDDSGNSHATIEMMNEGDWQTWFQNYTAMIVAQARIAEREKADLFVIGLEYAKTSGRAEDWKKVIVEVRKAFTGNITYAAHDVAEAEAIGFWDDLNLVGVNVSVPVTTETAKKSWADTVKRLEALSTRTGKPILITEVGASSAPGDEETQAKFYDAMLTALKKRPWLEGFFIWKYKIGVTLPEISREPGEYYAVFQDKKAEAVIRRRLKETMR